MTRQIQTALTVVCGLALVAAFFGLHPSLPYVSIAAGSFFAARSAVWSLRRRELDVNSLMVLAAIGAVTLGHPYEAAVLLFLFSLSSTLEEFAMARTKSAIAGLIKLRPEKAIRVTDHGDETVAVSELQVGDRVRIPPFAQVPADGTVVEGESSLDQSAMTGESVPVAKAAGDAVLMGTQNLDGILTVRVTTAAGDTTLEKIVALVKDAQENKASGERVSQWFGQRYTFFVIGAFVVSVLIRLSLGEVTSQALYASLTLLVALSPCALVISTPASTLSALAWAARNGILIRGGEFIELAGQVDTLAVDKTGTLTQGRPVLVELCVCQGALVPAGAAGAHGDECWRDGSPMSPEAAEMLGLAAATEQFSGHPLAQAIVRAAKATGVPIPPSEGHRVHAGLGVSAVVEGQEAQVGQPRFFEADGPLPPDFRGYAMNMRRSGMTVAVMRVGDRLAALGLRDAPRSEARAVLDELRGLGVRRVAMLTGDTPETARAVAEELGVGDVRAGLLPGDKERIIGELSAEGARVMMIGDGVNDAPPLARASVGVAMGGLGSDVALNAADIVLMRDKLEQVPDLIRLGRLTNRIVRANLIFAGGVIAALTLGTQLFDVFLPEYRNLILPMAVLGHEGSTVLVILNGLRLLRGPGR